VSSKLGEYMLKGWVLTDKSCPTTGCRVPLMRSPNGHTPVTWFCANCEGKSDPHSSHFSASESQQNIQSSPSLTSSTHYSRPSTPPTEVSSALSSPTFAPPIETEETVRRRQQSDAASSEIGKRLLKGWAMLADECPNTTCYGIPLVRPPKAGGEKDPRKECVVCGTIYIEEKDAHGFDRLMAVESAGSGRQGLETTAGPASRSIQGKGKGVTRDDTPMVAASSLPFTQPLSPPVSRRPHLPVHLPQAASTTEVATLETSARSLELTLSALSQRLLSLANQSILEPSSVSQIADAITKVARALSHIKQLQRGESLAFTS